MGLNPLTPTLNLTWTYKKQMQRGLMLETIQLFWTITVGDECDGNIFGNFEEFLLDKANEHVNKLLDFRLFWLEVVNTHYFFFISWFHIRFLLQNLLTMICFCIILRAVILKPGPDWMIWSKRFHILITLFNVKKMAVTKLELMFFMIEAIYNYHQTFPWTS